MLLESVSPFRLSINTSTSLALLISFLPSATASSNRGNCPTGASMDQGMELKGCVCRIKNCAVELVSIEEDLASDLDDESWDLVGKDLKLKAAFLYIDLSRVISRSEGDERRKALTLLANEFFYFMDQLCDAVASRSVSDVVKMCYGDAVQALREVVAAVAPPAGV